MKVSKVEREPAMDKIWNYILRARKLRPRGGAINLATDPREWVCLFWDLADFKGIDTVLGTVGGDLGG